MQHKFREATGKQNILNIQQPSWIFIKHCNNILELKFSHFSNAYTNTSHLVVQRQEGRLSKEQCFSFVFITRSLCTRMHPHHVSFHIPGAGLFSELLSTEFAVSWIDVHLSNRAFWVTVGHFFVRPQVLARLENFIAEVACVFWVRRCLFCMLAGLVIFQAVLCDKYFIADSARKVLLLSNIFLFEQVKFFSMNALLVPVKIFLQPKAIFAQLTEQMTTF